MTVVTLVTCTGARPEAFAICEKLIAAQSRRPSQWIVVDDGPEPTTCTQGQEYFRGPQIWKEGFNTQRANMDLALKYVKGDYVLIIEDDDWYHPAYIYSMCSYLEHLDLVGLSDSRYYHLQVPGHLTRRNFEHASLCQTGFRAQLLPELLKAIHSGELFFDVNLWAKAQNQGIPFGLAANTGLSVGMKGLPGRAGIGAGHKLRGYAYDAGHSKLKEWLGSDWKYYTPYLKGYDRNASS